MAGRFIKTIKSYLLITILFSIGFSTPKVEENDALSALWSYYKFNYIQQGKVVSLDENGITTSEGQSYAMLRAVWVNDKNAFDSIWTWTKENLQIRDDNLFAWKYKKKVLDKNAATDADVDIAVALILASRKYSDLQYKKEALKIIKSIWEKEVCTTRDGAYFLTAGNWALKEKFPTIRVGYLAPHAYEIFSEVDSAHAWRELVTSSYKILHWVYFDQGFALPPEIIYLDKQNDTLLLKRPKSKESPRFSYDVFPLFWRIALDARWNNRSEDKLRKAMLAFFKDEWNSNQKFFDTYTLDGKALSKFEGLPLYSTVKALAIIEDAKFADALREKLNGYWQKALEGKETPYYFHNWIWFGRAFELKAVKNYTEVFDFLSILEFKDVSLHFPWFLFFIAIILYIAIQFTKSKLRKPLRIIFLVVSLIICLRYLVWRLVGTLNFMEPAGPVISILLYCAEVYCFVTVLFLFLQVGFDSKNRRKPPVAPADFAPSVDIFIPIYSEPLDILDKTVTAAVNMDYPNKAVFVCDDSHREEVRELTERLGATYIKGPKKHAKAGNINNALSKTSGELVLIFDTDHIPVKTFLNETVPYFADTKVGILQTPHHFYNPDIFQRAFGTQNKVPNEADMFNHGIQGGRDNWGGAFFVGSGAVFRRKAIEEVGGIQLLSITEDIHTSMHIHSRGYTSVFVNKDLLAGFSAENLSGYLVQRRRWMLGCLQIFTKDNPLFMKGLNLRQKWGYFASLFYFFFPISRFIFWLTPLYFLLFHWHPIFSDINVLIAFLAAYMVVLPMINSVLLDRWPRPIWGAAYENVISFQLFRSMFDLFLPKNLGFKVTPKGVMSHKRSFDLQSTKILIVAAVITLFAIGKGIFEFFYFGIEKDAYFFNIGWAMYNLLLMGSSLLVAWERPQSRSEERIYKPFPCKVGIEDIYECQTHDLSLSGMSLRVPSDLNLPRYTVVEFENGVRVGARMLYREKMFGKEYRCGYRFEGLDDKRKRMLFLMIFSSPETWATAHDNRPNRSIYMVYQYFVGIIKCCLPLIHRRRFVHREKMFQYFPIMLTGQKHHAWIVDKSDFGVGIIVLSKKAIKTNLWNIPGVSEKSDLHHIYTKQIFPNVWRAGFELSEKKIVNSGDEEIGVTMVLPKSGSH